MTFSYFDTFSLFTILYNSGSRYMHHTLKRGNMNHNTCNAFEFCSGLQKLFYNISVLSRLLLHLLEPQCLPLPNLIIQHSFYSVDKPIPLFQ